MRTSHVTPKPHNAYADSALDASHECILEEVGKPVGTLCLYFTWYNLCRIRQTLRITPAMAAGITGQVWGLDNPISPL